MALVHRIKKTWSKFDLFGESGYTHCFFLYDVDSDGEMELVINWGAREKWSAVKQDDTIVWTTEYVDASTSTPNINFPNIKDGYLYQTHQWGVPRSDTRLHKIRLSDGNLEWSVDADGRNMAIDIDGNIITSGGTSTARKHSFVDGSVIWNGDNLSRVINPGQILAVGDIDGDGFDEVMMSCATDNYWGVLDHDGTLMFEKQNSNKPDWFHILNIDGAGNNEFVTVVDDDSSQVGEGDEIVTYNSAGTQLDKYTAANGKVATRVYEWSNGGRIFFAEEGGTYFGMLDANLDEIWKLSYSGNFPVGFDSNVGDQITLVDIDGDGEPEIFMNTTQNNLSHKLVCYDSAGNKKLFYTDESPTSLTNEISMLGWNATKIINSGNSTGRFRDIPADKWIQADTATFTTGEDKLHWFEFVNSEDFGSPDKGNKLSLTFW